MRRSRKSVPDVPPEELPATDVLVADAPPSLVETSQVEYAPYFRDAYKSYAVEVISGRAVPDVRDGLKPVQRRILYAMGDLGVDHTAPHKKSARIVGDTMGKYHPHGDTAIYDALVRLTQPFVMRLPLIEGQGNFGDGDDEAGAQRYTEARLTAAAESLLQDLGRDTVDFRPNYDGSLREPAVLPAMLPNMLVNGSTGAAVGIRTNMPPHNLGEVCAAVVFVCQHWARREKITVDQLMEHIPGPDFPTGGIVYRYRTLRDGTTEDALRQAYLTGQGAVVVQAHVDIEEIGGGKSQVVVSQLPYGVKKGSVLKSLADTVETGRKQKTGPTAGRLAGVADVRDESDRSGMRIVIETARGADPRAVLQEALRYSDLRNTFGIANWALVPYPDCPEGLMPVLHPLRDLLIWFIQHRLEVILRRSRYELARCRARLHIVEGLLKALDMLDQVIAAIRGSKTTDEARKKLTGPKFEFSDAQTQAILDMQLRGLVALERNKLVAERKELLTRIKYLEGLIRSEAKRLEVVVEETTAMREKFGTPRQTIIVDREDVTATAMVTASDLATPEAPQVLVLTADGGFLRVDADVALSQPSRKKKLSLQEIPPADRHLCRRTVSATAEVLLLTSQGRAWRGPVGATPRVGTRELGLARDEVLVGVAETRPDTFLVLGTAHGQVKRTKVADLLSIPERQMGVVMGLAEGDRLLFGGVAGAGAHILLWTAQGQVLRVDGDIIRPQQTASARGMAGIAIQDGDRLAGGAVVPAEAQGKEPWQVVVFTTKGYAHRFPVTEVPVKGRGTGGVRCLRPASRGGELAGIAVGPGAVVEVYVDNGRRFWLPVKDIPATARDALGERVLEISREIVQVVVLPELAA